MKKHSTPDTRTSTPVADSAHARYLLEEAARKEMDAITRPLDFNPEYVTLAEAFGKSALQKAAGITKQTAPEDKAEALRLVGVHVTAGTEILRRYREEYLPEIANPADFPRRMHKQLSADIPKSQAIVAAQLKKLKTAQKALMKLG